MSLNFKRDRCQNQGLSTTPFPPAVFFRTGAAIARGLVGLHLTIGTVILLGAAWLFGGIAEDLITGDPLILIDELISEWFGSHATARFTVGMHFASELASAAAILGLFALMSCVLLCRNYGIGYWDLC